MPSTSSAAAGTSAATAAIKQEPVDEDKEEKPSINEEKEPESEEEEDSNLVDEFIMLYNNGSYSPQLISTEEIEPGIFVIGEDEDNMRLDVARGQVLSVPGKKVEAVWTAEEKALQHEAKKGMTDDEATFAVETNIDTQIYLWSDKYRPRKPRYFNRYEKNLRFLEAINLQELIICYILFYTGSILGLNGINTTKLIMTWIIHHPKLSKDINLTSFFLI